MISRQDLKTFRKGSTALDRQIKQFYDSAAWKRTVIALLARDPICRIRKMCPPPGAVAVTLDHIIPLRLRFDLRFEGSNLQPACRDCNSWKRQDDRRRWRDLVKQAASIPVPKITF